MYWKGPKGYRNNPLISPCMCTGSMGYVHLICCESWRTRSRHDLALQGRNCETCSTPYTLPPPARPQNPVSPQEDGLGWLNATVEVDAGGRQLVLTAPLPAGADPAAALAITGSAYAYGPIPMMSVYDAATGLPVLPWNVSL